ncbi:MAG: NADH:flavin oxidoreductase [Chloroflexota bacterium]|nr:NADH:flavin oxidoreductase [Chloroflexota bacterium]
MPGLLDGIRIGSLELPNRLVMPPMANHLATEEGEVTDRLIAHYRERAAGVGLVIIEHCYVSLDGRMRITQPGVHKDGLVPGLRRLARAVQGEGSRVAIQINHCGGKAVSGAGLGPPAGPSPVPLPGSEIVPRELSVSEIREIVVRFGDAARRAREAGFDAVEVHGAHGYLNNQFTSPLTNRRTDWYGGSFENRMRLPLEIVEEVRRQVGRDYPLMFRLGASDMLDGGLTVEDGKRIAVALVGAGVDVVDVSGGLYGSTHPTIKGQGFLIPLAEEVKTVVNVPVIGVGGITDSEFADQVVRQGRVDMVAVGRAMLHDPNWARSAMVTLSGKPRQASGDL